MCFVKPSVAAIITKVEMVILSLITNVCVMCVYNNLKKECHCSWSGNSLLFNYSLSFITPLLFYMRNNDFEPLAGFVPCGR